jgi:hypothetical protein
MKRIILTVGALLFINGVNAQWSNKVVDNGFDDTYKICYTKDNNGSILKLENVDGKIIFYIQGSYFCSEAPVVDVSFLVGGEWKKYSFIAIKSGQSDALFIIEDLLNDSSVIDFKNCSFIKLRVNEEYCDTEIYQFNMAGSTSALNFISK